MKIPEYVIDGRCDSFHCFLCMIALFRDNIELKKYDNLVQLQWTEFLRLPTKAIQTLLMSLTKAEKQND